MKSLVASFLIAFSASPALAAKPPALAPPLDRAALAEVGLSLFWEARLPLAADERLKEAFLVDEALYVSTDRGALYSLHAETGLLRWGDSLTEAAYRIFSPTHILQSDRRGNVVIPTTTRTYIYDRFSGRRLGDFALDFPIGGPMVAIGNVLMAGSTNGRFYSLFVDVERRTAPVMRWEVATGGPVLAAPKLYGDRRENLLIASQAGSVFSCRAADKGINWHFRTSDAIVADAAVDDAGVYIPCLDRSLYKLNREQGTFVWRVRFPAPLNTAPTVVAQTAYQFCGGSGVTALDAITGEQKWVEKDATAFVAHNSSGDVLFTPGRLFVLDHEKGDRLGGVDAPGVTFAVSNGATDAAYLLGDGGRVYSVRLDKVPYLRRQQVMMARQQLNLPPSEAGNNAPVGPATRAADKPTDPFRSRHDTPPPSSP